MNYITKESSEIVWCANDDRYVLVEKQDDEVIGLNFMQGDEYEVFKENYNHIDKELTDFYNSIRHYLGGTTELDRINQAIWAYFEFRNLQDERKAL